MLKIAAPPIPAMALDTMSIIILFTNRVRERDVKTFKEQLTVAAPQSTEPNKKMAIPTTKTHFLPKISENFEKRGSMARNDKHLLL